MKVECQLDVNKEGCTCTYEPCDRKGRCCDCVLHHKRHGELPGCLFLPEIERTYDRSIAKFVEVFGNRTQSG